MRQALDLAYQAQAMGEVPIGAVLMSAGAIIAQGHNMPIASHDPTAHAEIQVLRAAGIRLANYRLAKTTLYVTLEPCAMCAMAIVHARVQRLVFGALDPRQGAAGSVFNLVQDKRLNHQVTVEMGLLSEESEELLRSFFKARR